MCASEQSGLSEGCCWLYSSWQCVCWRFAVACARPRHHLRLDHASDEALLGLGASQAPAPEAFSWAAEAYLAAAAHSPPPPTPQLHATSNQSRDTLRQPRGPGGSIPLLTAFPFPYILGYGGWGLLCCETQPRLCPAVFSR